MTRTEVARLLGVSRSTVQMLTRQGDLHCTIEMRNNRAYSIYDREEVFAFLQKGWKPTSLKAGKVYVHKRSEGSREARAIRMLNEGKTPWEVAEVCHFTMKEAAELWRRWKLGPHALLAEEQAEAIAKAEIDWAREMQKEKRRREWLEHTRKIAEIRANGKVPIILPERGEPMILNLLASMGYGPGGKKEGE